MAAGGSTFAVVSAIGVNSVILVAKTVGFFLTGSGAMMGEAIHTLADLFNQILLFIGIKRSMKEADSEHPYGYHAERFVWALISAVGIFFLGCGVTGYHAVEGLLHPVELVGIRVALIVLAVSLVLEGIVLLIAARELKQAAGQTPFFEFVRKGADPTTVAVLLEDGVAVTGCLVAFLSIGLTHLTGQPIWDALGSMVIAVLMGFVAIVLVIQNRRLLVGASVSPEVADRVLSVVRSNPSVEAVFDFKSHQLSVDAYKIKMEIDFDGRIIARRLEEGLPARYAEIKDYDGFVSFAGSYAEEVIEALGDEVDSLEAKIREQVPNVKHVDIETE